MREPVPRGMFGLTPIVTASSTNTFWRGTALSAVVLLFAAGPTLLPTTLNNYFRPMLDAMNAGVVVAVILDIVSDARARRRSLVTVWSLHSAQHASVAC